MHYLSPCVRGNLSLTKLLGRGNYEKVWRYKNSPPYVTARWSPQQIPPLNFRWKPPIRAPWLMMPLQGQGSPFYISKRNITSSLPTFIVSCAARHIKLSISPWLLPVVPLTLASFSIHSIAGNKIKDVIWSYKIVTQYWSIFIFQNIGCSI